MSSKHDPVNCLRHVIENAERVRDYLVGVDRTAFEEDGKTSDAVERCLERVCEAVVRLGADAEALMPGHPWIDIRGMGNRLRHAYDRIDLDIIWETAQVQLPALAAAAVKALNWPTDGDGSNDAAPELCEACFRWFPNAGVAHAIAETECGEDHCPILASAPASLNRKP